EHIKVKDAPYDWFASLRAKRILGSVRESPADKTPHVSGPLDNGDQSRVVGQLIGERVETHFDRLAPVPYPDALELRLLLRQLQRIQGDANNVDGARYRKVGCSRLGRQLFRLLSDIDHTILLFVGPSGPSASRQEVARALAGRPVTLRHR